MTIAIIVGFAVVLGLLGAPLLHQFALVPNGKAHLGAGEGMAAHGFHALGHFGVVGS